MQEITREDIDALKFLHDRLVYVHEEDWNVDFLIKAREVIEKLDPLVDEYKTK